MYLNVKLNFKQFRQLFSKLRGGEEAGRRPSMESYVVASRAWHQDSYTNSKHFLKTSGSPRRQHRLVYSHLIESQLLQECSDHMRHRWVLLLCNLLFGRFISVIHSLHHRLFDKCRAGRLLSFDHCISFFHPALRILLCAAEHIGHFMSLFTFGLICF